jgi:tRNA(Ile)-lysidine synthase
MPDNSLTPDSLTAAVTPLTSAQCWYVAFSGGCDSTVLLHLLNHYCRNHPQQSPRLVAVHINHQLQAPAKLWQQHCRTLCRTWDIDLIEPVVSVVDEGEGPEAAARAARYGAFEALLQPDDILFMGHHEDDQAETFLLRLLRGAGVQGLAAMPESRALGRGRLVRPLLTWSQDQLVAYARSQQLNWIEDPSNEQVQFDRNYLRQQVLPLIAQRWPQYRQTITRAARHLGEVAQELDARDEPVSTHYTIMGDPGFRLADIICGTPAQARRAVRRWLREQALSMPDEAALVEFVQQLFAAGADSAPALACRAFRLQRYRDGVFLVPASDGLLPDSQPVLPGQTLAIDGVGRVRVEEAGEACEQTTANDLVVDVRRGGERCHPAGRTHSLSLKQWLQESGVPPWWRDRIPLLKHGGRIVCIGDLWECVDPRQSSGVSLWKLHWERNSIASSD